MTALSQPAKNLIEEIGAKNLSALKAALEDGAALAILGIDDSDQDAVDEAHYWARAMIDRINSAVRNLGDGFTWLSDKDSENFFQMCCISIDQDTGATWGICGDYNLSLYGSPDLVRLIEAEILAGIPDAK